MPAKRAFFKEATFELFKLPLKVPFALLLEAF